MKTLTTIASVIVLLPQLLHAQSGADVPEGVVKAFKSAYPQAKDVEWEKEGEYFEAEYEENGLERSVLLDRNGSIISVESEILLSSLPSAIADYIGAEYGLSLIQEAEMVETSGQTFYVVEIDGDDGEVELVFDINGKLVDRATDDDEDSDKGDDDK